MGARNVFFVKDVKIKYILKKNTPKGTYHLKADWAQRSSVCVHCASEVAGPASVNVLPKEKGKEGLNAAITANNNSKPNVLQRK